jgi:hypothetical protein
MKKDPMADTRNHSPAPKIDVLEVDSGAPTWAIPERRLMLAVLCDAIICFQKGKSSNPRDRAYGEAKEWLFNDGLDWAFSFGRICDALGLDPDYLRRGLRQWKPPTDSCHRSSHVLTAKNRPATGWPTALAAS